LLTLIRALVITKVDYCISILAGAPAYLMDRLQSVLNAAARLIFSAKKSEHVTPLLRELHWLKVPERIHFRLCVLAFRCIHGCAPAYLADELCLAADIGARRRLRSADSSLLIVPSTRRSTIGDRAFPAAASRVWNSLPPLLRTATSLPAFKRNLKTFLFSRSFLC
jgi:hypothetical protein